MKIELSDLIDGEEISLEGEIDLSSKRYDLPIPESWTPLYYTFTVLRTDNECLVRGTVETEVTRDCDRCLKPMQTRISPRFIHSYDCSNSTAIDLTEDIREDILLSLPIAFRCQSDGDKNCLQTVKGYQDGPDEFDELRKQELWQELDKLEEK